MRFICFDATKSTVFLTVFLCNSVALTAAFSEYGLNISPFKTTTLNPLTVQLRQPKSSVASVPTPSNDLYKLGQKRHRGLGNRHPSSRLFQSSRNDNDGYKFFDGAPSTPGFKPGQFDKLTSWAMSTASNR